MSRYEFRVEGFERRGSAFLARLLALHAALATLLFAACSRSPVTPPAPTPAPVTAPAPPPVTMDDVLAARTAGKLDLYESGLQTLRTSADPATAMRAEALLGILYFDQKRYADALPHLDRAAGALTVVAPYLRLRVMTADQQLGDFRGAVAAANSIIQQTPASSAATTARIALPGLEAQAGDAAATDAAFAQLSAIGIDELSEGDFVEAGNTLAGAGRQDLATQLRARLLTQFPQGRYTERAYGQLAQLTPSPLDALPFSDAMNLAQKLGNHDRYDQELDLLRRIGQRFPQEAKGTWFRNVRLHALFNTRRYAELLADTAHVRLDDPALMLMRARAAWRAAKPDELLTGLQQVEREYPSSKEAAEAKVMRAKYYVTDENEPAKAVENLEAAIDAGAYGNEGENLWNLGWTYTLAQRWDDALRTFDKYERTFPDGDYLTNSLFWSGKILDRLGNRDGRDAKFRELMQKYPYSYYAYRAREIMGDASFPPADTPNGNVFPDVDAQVASLHDARLDAVRELAWLGLMRDAVREMKALAAAYPDNLGVAFRLADLYVQGGEPFKANGVLQKRFRNFVRHGGSNIPQRFWEILFPLNHWETIKEEGERRQIEPYLIASIIRQESGFEPTTVSNAGAVGIMQIMPEEAAHIAEQAGLPPPTREQLFDAGVNIAVGAAEYAQKLAAMNGNPTLAIAAYNAGEEAVGRWLAHTPVDDMDLFVETIPYAETRLYVKSVTRNRHEYRRIYEGATGSGQQQQQQAVR